MVALGYHPVPLAVRDIEFYFVLGTEELVKARPRRKFPQQMSLSFKNLQ